MKTSILFVSAVLCLGVTMVQAEPGTQVDRFRSLPEVSPCPSGQVQRSLPPVRGVYRFLCEPVQTVNPEMNGNPPMIELLGNANDVVLRCPFMISARKEKLRHTEVDGYYCINNRDDELGRTNLLGYIKPGANTVLSAVVMKKDEAGVLREETVAVAPGEPFSTGDDYQAILRYSGSVQVVAGTRSHSHRSRYRVK